MVVKKCLFLLLTIVILFQVNVIASEMNQAHKILFYSSMNILLVDAVYTCYSMHEDNSILFYGVTPVLVTMPFISRSVKKTKIYTDIGKYTMITMLAYPCIQVFNSDKDIANRAQISLMAEVSALSLYILSGAAHRKESEVGDINFYYDGNAASVLYTKRF